MRVSPPFDINRRLFLQKTAAFGALASLGGCTLMPPIDGTPTGSIVRTDAKIVRPTIGIDAGVTSPARMYAAITEGEFHLAAIPYEKIPRQFWRQNVPNKTGERPSTIIVNPREHFLYFVQPDGEVLRYGVGVGRAGFEWSGRAIVQYKREWPRWTPPPEMIARQPELVKYKDGMPAGVQNPLGARALYIFQNGVDTGYRIHGSPEWWSIGKSMSSGCIRLINQDIIDLYNRVPNGTPVVVL